MASWDVFRELDNLRREMDEAIRGVGAARIFVPPFLSGAGSRRFPLVNLSEDENNFYLEALIPGIEPKELDMTVLGNTLTISGERRPANGDVKGRTWHRNERGSGKFMRTLELPTEIDSSKVTAGCKNGVITVTMAKAETAKPKRIDVAVS